MTNDPDPTAPVSGAHAHGGETPPEATGAIPAVNPGDADRALADAAAQAIAPAIAEARAEGRLPTGWEIPDYLPSGNDSAAARKLASSAVAPLIAMARGYETVHEDTLKDAYAKYPLPRRSTAQGRRIAEAVQRGDLLIMPWFTHDDIVDAEKSMKAPKPATVQIRPAKPELNDKGKEIKYEFVGGRGTPIGMHPAFPIGWIDTTPAVLLAEGLLKGDSALTGYLLANGCSRADLSWTDADATGDHSADVMTARARLSALLDRITPQERVLILTIGGVDNWKNNGEWRTIRLNDRETWIGIDGDVSSNPNVHRAASELWDFLKEKKKSRPILIAPTVPVPDEPDTKKIGIDDYLADHGDWNGLLSMRTGELPSRPSGTDAEHVGTHRISEDGTRLEICKPVADPFNPDGDPIGGRWEEVLPLGGRILSRVERRLPTPEEVATGTLGAGVDGEAPWDVEIELSWKDPNDTNKICKHTIFAPGNILNYTPDLWDRHKAQIPAEILCSPFWPPSKKEGEEWLRAMKAHRNDEIQKRVRWDAMGWVPVENSVPAFIIGNQVIGSADSAEADIFPGIGEAELRGSSLFGVGVDDPRDLDDDTYREEIRANIENLIETYVLSGAWTDRKIASTVVAAGLRPALPIRPQSSVFCVGPPRKGKSYTAQTIMSFWGAKPDAFASSLPGSAKDTATAMELAVARSAIWVVDDLAPTSSRQQSEKEQATIADLVRNMFNGTAKRRSDQNMGTRQVYSPRALLVVTAENELEVSSARDRCVHINIGYGSLSPSTSPTQRVERVSHKEMVPAKVTQALIKYIRWIAKSRGANGDWRSVYDEMTQDHAAARNMAASRMKSNGAVSGDTKRHADSAGDIAVSLMWLRRLAIDVGVRPDILDLIRTDNMIADVTDLVSQGHRESGSVSPGKALIEAIALVLYRKKAHVLNALHPAAAPGDETIAANLGWELLGENQSRPKGDTIGWYVNHETYGEVLYIDQKSAFTIAQREFPSMIPPGQGYRSSWASAVGEGFILNDLCRPGNGGKRLSTGRERNAKHTLHEIVGTPVLLSRILARGEALNEEGRDLDS